MPYTIPEAPARSKKRHYIGVVPDSHIGYIVDHPTYSISAWDVMMQGLRHDIKRLTHVVLLGDVGNWESLSRWAALRADQAFVEEDAALVNARLDEFDELQKLRAERELKPLKFIYIEGNHEAWASQFEAKYPGMRDTVNLKKRLLGHRSHWTWIPENHFWAIGEAHFTHGHLSGCKTMTDLVKRTGVSVICGHWHTYSTDSLRTLTGEHAAWTMGCLASMDPPPPYVRGSVLSRVVQGFGRVQVRANGSFQVSFRRILGESYTELEDGTELRACTRDVARRYEQDQQIRQHLRDEYGKRFYSPGGQVIQTEPNFGRVSKKGVVSTVVRTNRARILRTLPEAKG